MKARYCAHRRARTASLPIGVGQCQSRLAPGPGVALFDPSWLPLGSRFSCAGLICKSQPVFFSGSKGCLRHLEPIVKFVYSRSQIGRLLGCLRVSEAFVQTIGLGRD